MSTTAVVQQMSLEERLTQRLHDSLGDLITDADLTAMIERGIEKALFQERFTEPSMYRGYREVQKKPALVDELVEKFLASKMGEAVDRWIMENPETMQAAVDKIVAASAGEALMKYLDFRFQNVAQQTFHAMQGQGLLPR